MGEHTPGPWTVTVDETPVRGPVAYVNGPPMYDAAFEVADARLIAAAPDLLAALERLAGWTRDLRFGYGMRGPEQPLDQARAAIAKAKGFENVAP